MIDINLGMKIEPKIIKLGANLSPEEQTTLVALLMEFADVFAWTYVDMPRLDPSIVVHHLVVCADAKRVKKKLRKMHPKIALLVKEELQKLLDVGFIRSIDYSD